MRRFSTASILCVLALLLLAAPILAQGGISTPPNGGNQKASVSQWLGLVQVTVDYNSPDVTAPNGDDRRGKIWGQLVPWGMPNLGFGTCTECPWRAGANENTVFTVSHDVEIEGKPLAAGSYGLHMIPSEDGKWTAIFSNNSTAWGSFFYDPAQDALRVEVTAEESAYTHWLSYEFTNRELDKATVALKWEDLQVPIHISVPDIHQLYLVQIRRELQNAPGFTWQNWNAAAQYCLQNKINLEEAVTWAQTAVSAPFIGEENFTTLGTLAMAQMAVGKMEDAHAAMMKAAEHPTATVINLHQLGRQLIGMDEKDAALRVFQLNAERHPGVWPVNVGLARGYSAMGDFDKALAHAKLALANVPEGDAVNKQSLEAAIKQLEAGKDIN